MVVLSHQNKPISGPLHCGMQNRSLRVTRIECSASRRPRDITTHYILCFSLTRSRIVIIARTKGSMQVGVAVTPAWSRSKLHSTSLCRRVCGLRRTAAYRPRQTPPANVRTRCAISEPASERHSEHQHRARLICSLLAAVTLVSLARASIFENSTRKDCTALFAGRP